MTDPDVPAAGDQVKSTFPRAPRYRLSPAFFSRIRTCGYTMVRLAEVADCWNPSLFSLTLRNVFAGTPETIKRLEAIARFIDFPVDQIVIPGPPAWNERVPDRGWEKTGEGL